MRVSKSIVCGFLGSMIVAVVGMSGSALAYSTIEQKALGYGVYKCYTGFANGNNIMLGSIKPSELSSYESIVLYSGQDYIALPTGFSALHQIGNNNVSCEELFGGYHYKMFGGTYGGLFERAGVNGYPTTENEKKDFLTLMGYDIDPNVANSGGKCLRFKLRTFDGNVGGANPSPQGSNIKSAEVCSKTGSVNSNDIEVRGVNNFGISFEKDGGVLTMTMFDATNNEDGTKEKKYQLGAFSTFDEFANTISEDVALHFGGGCQNMVFNNPTNEIRSVHRKFACIDATDFVDRYDLESSAELTYSIADTRQQDNRAKAAFTASNNLLGSSFSSRSDLAFDNGEKYLLYRVYLDDFYKVDRDCDYATSTTTTEQSLINAGYKKVPYYQGEGEAFLQCYVKPTEHSTEKVYGLSDEGYFDGTELSFEQIADELLRMYEDGELDSSEIDDVGQPQAEDPSNPKSRCMSGAAGALGWIVCPIMEWMIDATDNIYNDYIVPALKIDPQLFSVDDSSPAKRAWGIFQGFANMIFIIILLIVIFSQLTGVGIDNYGIKKILPKLIIAAILVNLSYYICVICIDVSNILGNGIQSMFMEMGKNLNPINFDVISGEYTNTVDMSGAGGSTVMTAVPILAALAAGGVAIYLNPAILLTLLVSAIGVIVAIFFLFALLSAREAAIIVLMVISPVAFVLYMLPNTKKLFDRWLSVWKALLILYPICGLLIGGGNFVSKLLISNGVTGGGFVSAFMAMIIGIVPIFFIPTLLRNSLSALGNIGAKISGFGQRISSGVQRGARNSEGYKNAQRMGLERRTRVRAGLDRNGNLTEAGERRARRAGTGFGRFFGMDKRQAAYVAQARNKIGESEAAGALLTGALARTGIAEAEGLPDSGQDEELGRSFAEHTEGAYYGGQFLEAADAGDITNMNATIEAMRSSGMKPKDIAKLMRYANNHGHFNNMNDNTRAAWFRELSKKYGNDFLATDFELNSYLRAGGFGRDASGNITGALGGYGEYGGVKIDDVKPEDIVKLSGDSMAGLAASGVLNQSMAQRVIAMNPNISADKKIMLGAIASGAANATTINDVAQFKKDAETLMKDYNAGSPVAPATMSANGAIDRATVEAWASATPQSVNVVQNFNGGGSQIGSVDVNLRDIGGQRLGGGGTNA